MTAYLPAVVAGASSLEEWRSRVDHSTVALLRQMRKQCVNESAVDGVRA
jgi:hypothetical protein